MGLYDHPFYYDVAFSFRDIRAEVRAMETLIERYSKRRVRRVLEVACGNAPHMAELSRRGYDYIGLDQSPTMLDYSHGKATTLGVDAEFIQGDMRRFVLEEPVDFAFIALGSLYVTSPAELENHLASMAEAVRPGGLYLLDWAVTINYSMDFIDRWKIKKRGVFIDCEYREKVIDPVRQLAEEHIRLKVKHGNREFVISDVLRRKLIFPEEFRLLMRYSRDFEFVGWWSHFDPDEPLEADLDADFSRVLTAIRRR